MYYQRSIALMPNSLFRKTFGHSYPHYRDCEGKDALDWHVHTGATPGGGLVEQSGAGCSCSRRPWSREKSALVMGREVGAATGAQSDSLGQKNRGAGSRLSAMSHCV
jgi:hypothetical protein